jgi:hypothetical protein
MLNNISYLKFYIYTCMCNNVSLMTDLLCSIIKLFIILYFQIRGKITAAAETGDDAAFSIADEELTQDMQQRHDDDLADINLLLDGRQHPVATPTTTSPEQAPPSSMGGKKKSLKQRRKEQDAAFLSHTEERADATA